MKITGVVVLLLAFTCYCLLPVLVPKIEAHGSCQSLRAEWARKLADSVSKWWGYVKAAARYIANPTFTNKLKAG